MIQFQFLGIPVRIEPLFWLSAFFLGGGLHLGKSSGSTKSDLVWVMMWMLVACFSILVHEYGHALTARKLSGGRNDIKLWAMGGLAYHEGGRPTRRSRLWTIAMGPGAGLLLFLLTCLAILGTYGRDTGVSVIQILLSNDFKTPPTLEVWTLFNEQPPLLRIFDIFLQINFWWSLINLLPVFPLDGGQLLSTWTGKTLLAYKVGAFVGAVTALVGLVVFKEVYVAVLFGFLAYQNYKRIETFKTPGNWR